MTTSHNPLSIRLREGTRKGHRAVESLDFVRSFLRGVISLENYGRYLIDLEHVYTELERSLCAHSTHPVLHPLIIPALWRRQPLRDDIDYLASRQPLPRAPSAPARRYGDRLRAISKEEPERLVAHAYTRYLGDLSGGQILSRIVARALHLSSDAGLRFYAFPEIGELSEFKRAYRARLDSLPVDEGLAQHILDEANTAFALTGAILQALPGSATQSIWRLLLPASFAPSRLS